MAPGARDVIGAVDGAPARVPTFRSGKGIDGPGAVIKPLTSGNADVGKDIYRGCFRVAGVEIDCHGSVLFDRAETPETLAGNPSRFRLARAPPRHRPRAWPRPRQGAHWRLDRSQAPAPQHGTCIERHGAPSSVLDPPPALLSRRRERKFLATPVPEHDAADTHTPVQDGVQPPAAPRDFRCCSRCAMPR